MYGSKMIEMRHLSMRIRFEVCSFSWPPVIVCLFAVFSEKIAISKSNERHIKREDAECGMKWNKLCRFLLHNNMSLSMLHM